VGRTSNRSTVVLAVSVLVTIGALVTLTVEVARRPASPSVLLASAPSNLTSGKQFNVTVLVSAALAEAEYFGAPAESGAFVELLAWRDGVWRPVLARPVDGPNVVLPASVWKDDRLRVRLSYRETTIESNVLDVTAGPAGRVVSSTLPEPAVPYPAAPRAVSRDANPVVTPVGDAEWQAMNGVTWQPGCPVGRDGLALISVNYWGFDGYRHRGRVIVAKSVASRAAAALADLHDAQFPIRQMLLPEAFGRGPQRGANDYASMRADNTSGFNCRYVVGREKVERLSPHAYGLAIDVNPWENPYASPYGVLPAPAWVGGSAGHPAVLRSASDPAVVAFTSRGAVWGGAWKSFDFQHFEWRASGSGT